MADRSSQGVPRPGRTGTGVGVKLIGQRPRAAAVRTPGLEPEVKFRLGDPGKGRYSVQEGFAGSADSDASTLGPESTPIMEYGRARAEARRSRGIRVMRGDLRKGLSDMGRV